MNTSGVVGSACGGYPWAIVASNESGLTSWELVVAVREDHPIMPHLPKTADSFISSLLDGSSFNFRLVKFPPIPSWCFYGVAMVGGGYLPREKVEEYLSQLAKNLDGWADIYVI